MKHLVMALTLMALAISVPAAADELGSIKGTVTMADGKTPAVQHEVLVIDLSTGKTVAKVKTDGKGQFNVASVPVGLCKVVVSGKNAVDLDVGKGETKVKLVQKPDTKAQGVRRGGTNRKKLVINLIGGFVAALVIVGLIALAVA